MKPKPKLRQRHLPLDPNTVANPMDYERAKAAFQKARTELSQKFSAGGK